MVGFNDIFLKLTTFMKFLFRTFFWKEVSLKNSKVIFEGCLFIIENSREEVFRWDTSWFPNEKILKNLIFLKVAVSKYSFDLYTKLDTSWSHRSMKYSQYI